MSSPATSMKKDSFLTSEAPLQHTFPRNGGDQDRPSEVREDLQRPTDIQVEPSQERPLLWIVEDNHADVFLVRKAVDEHHVPVTLTVVGDGEEALRYLNALDADPSVPCPGIVLLDLNLPKRPGTEILARFRAIKRCLGTPVVVLTSSDSLEDRQKAAELGATRYFRKPTSYREFLAIGELLNELLGGTARIQEP